MSLVNRYKQDVETVFGAIETVDTIIGGVNERSAGFEEGDRPRWREPEDEARFEKYRVYKDLFFGDHEKRIRPEWLAEGNSNYKTYNFCRFISKVYADLMMGKGVEVKTGSEMVDDYIADVVGIADYMYNWVLQASVFGFVAIQIVSDSNGVDILEIEPELIFPKFNSGSGYDYEWIAKKHYVDPGEVIDPEGSWEFDKEGTGDGRDGIVFEERHYRGKIEYYLYVTAGNDILEMLPPRWYNRDLPELDGRKCVVETGIKEFLLMIIPNILFMKQFVSDYDDIAPLQKSLNSRGTQIERILNVHADPKLMLPDSMQQKDHYTGQVSARGLRDEVIFVNHETAQSFKPEYLTWSAELSAAETEMTRDVNMLCTFAEISPMLISRNESGSFPESAVAYKLKMTPSLNRAAVKSRGFVRYTQRIMWVLIQLLDKQGNFKTTDIRDDAGVAPVSMVPGAPATADAGTLTVADDAGKSKNASDIIPTDIEIRMIPALPQDDRFLAERLAGQASVSRHRVLIDVDSMSERQAAEEIKRIDNDLMAVEEQTGYDNGLGFTSGGGFKPSKFEQRDEQSDGGLHDSPTGAQSAGFGSGIQ